MIHAKKSLGQHFLTSLSALNAIIDAGDPTGTDIILEIGPGLGALTKHLLLTSGKVVAIEKDSVLFEKLKTTFKEDYANGRLDLLNEDILDFDPSTLAFYKNFDYKIIANIPYNITGAIIRKFLTALYQPELMVLLVQKEVAERIVAKEKESVLSISVKVYGTPKYIRTVPKGAFSPAPSVDSAIISIQSINRKHFNSEEEEELFFHIVHLGFAHKRKKLIGNLSILGKEYVKDLFTQNSINFDIRAEDLSLSDWLKLAKGLKGKI